MNEMKRVTVTLSNQLEWRIAELKASNPRFYRASFSEVIRVLIDAGLEKKENDKNEKN